MAHEFRLPDIGEGLTDAEIVAWHVAVGDEVAKDQRLVEVETAKAVVEITSPFAGTVIHLGGGAGDTIEVGEVLVVIGSPNEAWGDEQASSPAPEAPVAAATAAALPPSGPVRAMPIVRKLAQEHGIDLTTVRGTGPAGAITRADVEAAIAGARTQPSGGEERVPLTRMRQTIAEHMARSWREIPHVTVQADVDASALLAEKGGRPLEALVARCVLPLLARFPEFNASLDGSELVMKRHYHLGFAVDTPDGLLVTVVRDADRMSTEELGLRVSALAEKAVARTVAPEEVTGQTFTLSNIGALGGGHGTPIIPWGTTAILSVGRAVATPVAREGGLFVAPVMPIDLSYDHRVIDGGLGQRFLAALVESLEHPGSLL